MNYGYWVFTVSLARAVRCCSRSASRCSWRWGRGWGRAAGTVCTANSLVQQIKHNKLKLQWPPVHPDVVVPAEGGGDHAAMAGVGGGSGLQGQHTGPDQLMYIFCSDFKLMHTKLKCKHFTVSGNWLPNAHESCASLAALLPLESVTSLTSYWRLSEQMIWELYRNI